jgi:uncharacterized protein (DUF58 family)
MATPPLTRAALPGQPALQAFAAAAAQLLVERQPRAPGARTVSRRAGAGLQHLDHRDYAPGDEVRHIDWRQTARQRRPVIRRFEAESMTDWTLLLDVSSSMAAHGGVKWQAAVNAAAAMAYALLQLGHRVGLLAFGARVLAQCPPGRGQHHYAAIARRLGTLQPAPGGEASHVGACARHLHGAASVLVISDFLADGEMCAELGALQQRCAAVHALQLDDDADTQLALAGEFELVDVESGARLQALLGAQANAAARAERAAMTARLRRYCARSGVACTSWPLAQPWQHALIEHLMRARSHC